MTGNSKTSNKTSNKAGVYGYFEVTHDVSQYTRAAFLSEVGKKTDVFAKFSIFEGQDSPDAEHDLWGFAVRFYTEQGDYDMVGNHTPVFLMRDALKFPDLIRSQKRCPVSNQQDFNMFWDFISLLPESVHQVTILFSDRGTPGSYRYTDGYSSHAFMWYNKGGDHVWVKYHFKTEQAIKNLTMEEAGALYGQDPDYAARDLYDSIDQGDFPAWKVYVQIMTPEQAETYPFDPFDVTKVWYHADFPLIPVGKMVLNSIKRDHFTEVEKAFAPSNFVPGIAASPDKMLQGRLLNCLGTDHLHDRFGNSHQIPEVDVSRVLARHAQPLEELDFVQAGELYRRVLSESDRVKLVQNIAAHLGNAQRNLQLRQTAMFYKADEDYGTRVAKALGIPVDEVQKLAAMTQAERVKATQRLGSRLVF